MINRNLFSPWSEIMGFTAWIFKRLVISQQNNVKSPVPNLQHRISKAESPVPNLQCRILQSVNNNNNNNNYYYYMYVTSH
jgi:hypothetical protein